MWILNPLQLELRKAIEQRHLFVIPGIAAMRVDASMYEHEDTVFGRL